jgi:hypothetical protein
MVGAVLCFVFTETGRTQTASTAFAATAVAFATALFGFALMRVDQHQQNHELLSVIEECGQSPRVGAFKRLEPTWIYYGGWPIDELTLEASDRTSTSQYAWKPKPRLNAAEFFADGNDRFIITTDSHWAQLRAALPVEATVLAECPLFLKDERLLLIGAKGPTIRAANRDKTIRK